MDTWIKEVVRRYQEALATYQAALAAEATKRQNWADAEQAFDAAQHQREEAANWLAAAEENVRELGRESK